MNWVMFWKAVLVFTLCGYSILVIIVFFGGLRNIVDMLRELKAPVEEREDD
jgi:hypothetical protein